MMLPTDMVSPHSCYALHHLHSHSNWALDSVMLLNLLYVTLQLHSDSCRGSHRIWYLTALLYQSHGFLVTVVQKHSTLLLLCSQLIQCYILCSL